MQSLRAAGDHPGIHEKESNTGLSIGRNSYLVDNGYLYINGDPAARITIKDRRNTYDEESYYTEGRILARQETF